MSKVEWTNLAEEDLISIIEYIAEESVTTALKNLTKIKNIVLLLEESPKQGRVVPELKQFNIDIYKEIIFSEWRIIYKIDKNTCYITAVLDSKRNIEDLLMERLLRE